MCLYNKNDKVKRQHGVADETQWLQLLSPFTTSLLFVSSLPNFTCLQKMTHVTSLSFPSIHQSIHYPSGLSCWESRGWWSQSQLSAGKRQGPPLTGHQSVTGLTYSRQTDSDSHPHALVWSPLHVGSLLRMNLACLKSEQSTFEFRYFRIFLILMNTGKYNTEQKQQHLCSRTDKQRNKCRTLTFRHNLQDCEAQMLIFCTVCFLAQTNPLHISHSWLLQACFAFLHFS